MRMRYLLPILLSPWLLAGALANPYETTLANGLRVIVKEDHRSPVVVSQVWYKVGSQDEPKGLTGISHVLEHMMFKGTAKHGPNEFSRIIAENGGRENAFTGTDYTSYFQQLEKSRLGIAFELEADRMQNLLLDEKDFKGYLDLCDPEYRYSITANTWTTIESIPAMGSAGKKKMVKKGAVLASTENKLYATKGGGTLDWWCYDPALSGSTTYPWSQKADVPIGAKTVTYDFHRLMEGATQVSCSGFGQAMIARM